MNPQDHAINRAKSVAHMRLADGEWGTGNYRLLLHALEENDEEVLGNMEPPQWTSGEWAGESLLEIFGHDPSEEEIETYDGAADIAYWQELEAICRSEIAKNPESPKYVLTVRFECDDWEWVKRISDLVGENFHEDSLLSNVTVTVYPEQ